MSKNIISPDKKISAIKSFLNGEGSQRSIAAQLGISYQSFQQWIRNYKSMGTDAFTMIGNKKYSSELKLSAVQDYLACIGSQDDICLKYGIRSKCKLQEWIMKYNSHEELKSSGMGGTAIMTKGRKTTYDERIEIVQYCIEHENNYAETAEKYKVSYQQVYTWLKKYEEKGVEGLRDRRGRTKPEDEMSELEILRAENRLLKAQNKRQEMEMAFLKKLDEIERRRF
jgi:transposase-like protein